jgi:hypothetical protein
MTLLAACLSPAALIFDTGNGPATDTVLIDDGTGMVLTGTSNSQTVTFTGNETLIGNGGQAKITAQDGVIDTALTISIPGYGFTEFEIDPTRGSMIVDNTLDITVVTTMGVYNFSSDIDNGTNQFNLVASGGELILSVTMEPTVGVEDYRQLRIDGVAAIPEPGSFALLSLAAPALYLLRRYQQK